jgi:L-serine kinase (ADP)
MSSISINEPLITSNEWVLHDEIYPHEEVVEDRYKSLQRYLESLKPYAIIPSIIICDKTNVIIDGHHRYFSLTRLGFKLIPTTKINYDNKSIITDINNPIAKNKIINAGKTGSLLKPKTSFHHVKDFKGELHPIILISSLFKLDF